MRRVTTVLLGLVGILLAGSHNVRASQQEKPKVIRLSEQSQGPITFPKIDRKPNPARWGRGEIKSLPKYDPDSRNGFQVDLRCRDLSKLDLRNSVENLLYSDFDDRTVWPASDKMPNGFTWQRFMELGKNPGLGVRTLHERGITGKGVGVAIIDQTLLTEHIEYADSLRLYEENNIRDGTQSSMHGAAVASIAVGKTVGVAPDADLYYIATWGLTSDDNPLDNFVFRAQSIRRLLEINRQLPADRKIRVISNSIGWSPSQEGYDEITAACEEAKAAGIFVVSCGIIEPYGFDFGGLGRHPLANPDSFESYGPCLDWAKIFYNSAPGRDSDTLWVPEDSRATASFTGGDEYVFYRQGGASWCAPYIAGIYALAAQVEPEITPERFWDLAMKTGRTIELEHKGERRSFGPIIDPVRLIRSISDNGAESQQAPSKNTIVPGVGIGDYTLDMSKDDVLKKLGKPDTIQLGEDEIVRRGEEKYSLDNLPSEYALSFGDISFYIKGDSLELISVRSPLYKLSNGLGVGDSQQKIKEAFGENFWPREEEGRNFFRYDAKGLGFEIDKKNQTVAKIFVYKPQGDRGDREDQRETPKMIMLSDQPPGPITFPKIDRQPAGSDFGRGALESLPHYNPKSTENWQVDLRGRDVSRLDLRKSLDDLLYADFDSRTTWPTADRMPEGFDHERIMEFGKNPGLGVRKVHERGITGRGIGIAIVDQPLLTKHQEYADRLRLYEENNIEPGSDASMHGAAVASVAVGKTVGVAPEADLYYIASWTGDWGKGEDGFEWNFAYYAQAVRRILEINKQLPDDRKIRVISISVGWSSKRKGYDEMTAAVEEAKKAGMLVVCSCIDDVHGFVFDGLGRAPLSDPEDYASYKPGLWLAKGFYLGQRKWNQLWVPMDSRTTAAPNGVDEYVFYRQGGWSWAIPYVAGVYALAAQVDPEITPERFWKLAMKTGRTIEVEHQGRKYELGPIADPGALIDSLEDK